MLRLLRSSLFKKSVEKLKYGSRCLSKGSKDENLFPERVDFPSRHIGPRDQDVVTMLDLLGYKVSENIILFKILIFKTLFWNYFIYVKN